MYNILNGNRAEWQAEPLVQKNYKSTDIHIGIDIYQSTLN